MPWWFWLSVLVVTVWAAWAIYQLTKIDYF